MYNIIYETSRQSINKHMKRCSTSLSIRETQIKAFSFKKKTPGLQKAQVGSRTARVSCNCHLCPRGGSRLYEASGAPLPLLHLAGLGNEPASWPIRPWVGSLALSSCFPSWRWVADSRVNCPSSASIHGRPSRWGLRRPQPEENGAHSAGRAEAGRTVRAEGAELDLVACLPPPPRSRLRAAAGGPGTRPAGCSERPADRSDGVSGMRGPGPVAAGLGDSTLQPVAGGGLRRVLPSGPTPDFGRSL